MCSMGMLAHSEETQSTWVRDLVQAAAIAFRVTRRNRVSGTSFAVFPDSYARTHTLLHMHELCASLTW